MGKIPAFHTNSTLYRPEDRKVFHDQSECGYAQRIKRDGNDVPGTANRARCDRCEDLAAA